MLYCFQKNIIFIYFPKSISFRFYPDHKEIDWYIFSFWYLFIFLHDTHNYICLFLYCNKELRIVEPFIVGIIMNGWNFVVFFSFIRFFEFLHWVWPSSCVSLPFTTNWVLWPCRWENFAEVYHTEIRTKIIKSHPPISITLELIIKFFFETLMIIPCFIFVTELSCPITTTPRVSYSHEL